MNIKHKLSFRHLKVPRAAGNCILIMDRATKLSKLKHRENRKEKKFLNTAKIKKIDPN